jgi:hypothetical protein
VASPSDFPTSGCSSNPATGDKDEPDRQSRYEVVGTGYIKKVIKALRRPLHASSGRPLTVRMAKKLLDKLEAPYIDASPVLR